MEGAGGPAADASAPPLQEWDTGDVVAWLIETGHADFVADLSQAQLNGRDLSTMSEDMLGRICTTVPERRRKALMRTIVALQGRRAPGIFSRLKRDSAPSSANTSQISLGTSEPMIEAVSGYADPQEISGGSSSRMAVPPTGEYAKPCDAVAGGGDASKIPLLPPAPARPKPPSPLPLPHTSGGQDDDVSYATPQSLPSTLRPARPPAPKSTPTSAQPVKLRTVLRPNESSGPSSTREDEAAAPLPSLPGEESGHSASDEATQATPPSLRPRPPPRPRQPRKTPSPLAPVRLARPPKRTPSPSPSPETAALVSPAESAAVPEPESEREPQQATLAGDGGNGHLETVILPPRSEGLRSRPPLEPPPPRKPAPNQRHRYEQVAPSSDTSHPPVPPLTAAREGPPVPSALQHCLWYHGNLGRAESEALLNPHIAGHFLVRDSASRVGDYSLSVVSEGTIKHFRIRRRPDGYYSIGEDQTDMRTFVTVDSMISYHSSTPLVMQNGESILLNNPCMSVTGGERAPFVFGEVIVDSEA